MNDDLDIESFLSSNPFAKGIMSKDSDSVSKSLDSVTDSIDRVTGYDRTQTVEDLYIENIDISKQVRTEFSNTEIEELADSIEQHGLLTPVTVERCGSRYKLLCGEKRIRACKLLGLEKIRANIFEFKESNLKKEAQITVIQIIENLQRSNPTLSDYVNAVQSLKNVEENISKEKIAKLISKSEDYISRLDHISNLSDVEKTALLDLGFYFLKNTYLPLKNLDEDKALKSVFEVNTYLEDHERTPELNEKIKEQFKKLYEKLKKQKEKEKIVKEPKEKKASATSVSLNKIKKEDKDLAKKISTYMKEQETDFDELISLALNHFFEDLKQ